MVIPSSQYEQVFWKKKYGKKLWNFFGINQKKIEN